MSVAESPAGVMPEPHVGVTPLYSDLSMSERYIHTTRDRAMLTVLRRHGFANLQGLRILDLGCGEGSLLRSLLYYGADKNRLQGIDADVGRIARARMRFPGVRVAGADIGALPHRDGSFDLAFAFTVFSSVLDNHTRNLGAAEAMRVLRPGGLLLVYDFALNPMNTRVRPLRERELLGLFARRSVEVHRITLAPPIVRLLGGRSAPCGLLEQLPFLRTHLLAAVRA